MVYNVKGMWWNGDGWDSITKDCKTKKATIGAVNQLLKEIMPYQILITDLDNKEPIPNDLLSIASSLNSKDDHNQQVLDGVMS